MYSHLVTIIKDMPALGIAVPSSFRTTADAVEMHRAACVRRRERRNIVSFSIRELSVAEIKRFDERAARFAEADDLDAKIAAADQPVNFPVGSLVLTYDFPRGRRDCWLEGVVEAVGGDTYSIRVSRVVREEREAVGSSLIGSLVCPPINGLDCWLGGKTDGVVAL